MPDQPGELPLELPWQLLITLFSSLPGLRPIAVCACVSRHWRRAAAQAVPKSVTIDARNSKEVLQLLTKSCNLGAVESVVVLHVEEAAAGFPQGALFARMCAEATCLRDVILPSEYFHMLALVPASITKLLLRGYELFEKDLAPLARLTQLKVLGTDSCLTSPLPQLPALTKFVGRFISDFQALSGVSATLEHLTVLSADDLDFKQPVSLTHFTRLHTLVLSADSIRNFCPEVLPPNLRCMKLQVELIHDAGLAFPVGTTVFGPDNEMKWTCPV